MLLVAPLKSTDLLIFAVWCHFGFAWTEIIIITFCLFLGILFYSKYTVRAIIVWKRQFMYFGSIYHHTEILRCEQRKHWLLSFQSSIFRWFRLHITSTRGIDNPNKQPSLLLFSFSLDIQSPLLTHNKLMSSHTLSYLTFTLQNSVFVNHCNLNIIYFIKSYMSNIVWIFT